VLIRLKLQEQQSRLARVQAVDRGGDQAAKLTDAVSKLRERIAEMDNRLIKLCDKAEGFDPDDADPRRLLFLMWVDARSFDKARHVALETASLPQLEAALAGKMANMLLDREARYQQLTTRDDIDVSRRLLTHPNLSGTYHIDYRVARARLALHERRYADARQIAGEILMDYRGHPSGTCLLAFALMGLDQPQRAIEVLTPLNRRVRAVDVRYALGTAYLQSGQTDQGQDLLRQSLEIHPNYLPSLLALAEALVDAGHVAEAEPEITELVSISPDHPDVVRLRLRRSPARA